MLRAKPCASRRAGPARFAGGSGRLECENGLEKLRRRERDLGQPRAGGLRGGLQHYCQRQEQGGQQRRHDQQSQGIKHPGKLQHVFLKHFISLGGTNFCLSLLGARAGQQVNCRLARDAKGLNYLASKWPKETALL
jgi:hypothetical protein